jgi:hypothetical protein
MDNLRLLNGSTHAPMKRKRIPYLFESTTRSA